MDSYIGFDKDKNGYSTILKLILVQDFLKKAVKSIFEIVQKFEAVQRVVLRIYKQMLGTDGIAERS